MERTYAGEREIHCEICKASFQSEVEAVVHADQSKHTVAITQTYTTFYGPRASAIARQQGLLLA